MNDDERELERTNTGEQVPRHIEDDGRPPGRYVQLVVRAQRPAAGSLQLCKSCDAPIDPDTSECRCT